MDTSAGMILLLGAVHGVNPAMGWLFAVSLGLQSGRSSAVWKALGPLALGHALAIGAALAAAAMLGLLVPIAWLRWIASGVLLGFGIQSLVRHRHPKAGGGMQVGARDLTVWSFLMASAHGAGLMVLPFVLSAPESGALHGGGGHGGHVLHAASAFAGAEGAAVAATLLHTTSYLVMAGVLAWLVYTRLGLRVLRSAWINIDLVWGIALIVTGVLTVVL